MGAPEPLRPLVVLAALLMAETAGARPQAGEPERSEDPRRELEVVQRALDRSVGSVSRIAGMNPFGTESCRGYHVKGYGAVFVVPPRALPIQTRSRRTVIMGFEQDPLETGIRALEESLEEVGSEDVRQRMRAALEEVRRSRQRRVVEEARVNLRRAQEKEQQANRDVRETRKRLDDPAVEREAELRAVLESAIAYQREAEKARQAAEAALRRALEEAQREARAEAPVAPARPGKASVPPPPPIAVAPPAMPAGEGPADVPAAPATPAQPATVGPPSSPAVAPVPVQPAVPPTPTRVPLASPIELPLATEGAQPPNVADLLPPAPPWSFWFETDEGGETRTPDEVIASVGEAVTAVLEAHGARLKTLSPDESVIVAVDFLPEGTFMVMPRRAPSRTLVVRVRKKELEDRVTGKMSAEEFRRRIEYVQY
jgi:hypothetical protein